MTGECSHWTCPCELPLSSPIRASYATFNPTGANPIGVGFGSNFEAMNSKSTNVIATFAIPRPGESLCVVSRWRKSTPQMVPILKVTRFYVHIARNTVPLEDLLVNGVHHGDNDDYWTSSALYDICLSNQVLLNQLKSHVAQLKPQHLSSSDIHAAALNLGLQLS